MYLISVLFLLSHVVQATITKCPEYWQTWNSICWFLSSQPLSYNESLAYCQDGAGSQTGVARALDTSYLQYMVSVCGGGDCWIGGTNEGWETFDDTESEQFLAYDADSELVQQFFDPQARQYAADMSLIPASYKAKLNGNTWDIKFEPENRQMQAICSVMLNAIVEEDIAEAHFPPALFAVLCILFVFCLFYSYWKLRQIRADEQEGREKKLRQLTEEAKARRESRTPV